MPERHSTRRYPRMLRVNEVVREALAEELERMSDPRLGMVTITGVEVAPDLRHATVYYAALGREDEGTLDALRAAAPHLRAALGRQVRLKYLPRLDFRSDPAIERGQRVEEIIRHLHDEDAQHEGDEGGNRE
ncbi:MAG TPA: 30S ribosome-binding factor RbfA [Acidimicrobiia bacterium]|nr:30S ribosome-binding factor RbfA [Acidimicrobiia bacterium]